MPTVERQGHDIESGGSPQRDTHAGHAKNDDNHDAQRKELQIFGLKLTGLPGWGLYIILASMVFVLSLSAAYCAELVFIQAGSYDICTCLAHYLTQLLNR